MMMTAGMDSPAPPTNRLYLETFGCQMNERDSEIMAQLMADAGYLAAGHPADADLIVVNTCSIRDKAEQKAYSSLGRFRKLKQRRPGLVIAVTGCVAQQQGKKIRARLPHVDLVVGPQQIYQLPALVEEVRRQAAKRVVTRLAPDFQIPPFLPRLSPGNNHKRFVTIMQGCNNFCTYCVVPYTRGREVSRPSRDILAEVRHLADQGVREVTLLGQNVNSYGQDRPEEPAVDFPALLRLVAGVEGIARVRFTTSHPKDLSEELMRCFAELDKLCPHLHLPVQSGANPVLARMNRKYTVEEYLAKVEGLRRYRPDIALTTDLIVGFPGESEADFAATMELLETVRYHGAFSFKYSDRPAARAADFGDKVTEETKTARLAALQALQERITLERNRQYQGQRLAVMVEEANGRRRDGFGRGRTIYNQVVNFPCDRPLAAGEIIEVLIEEGLPNSLRGRLVAPAAKTGFSPCSLQLEG